jgi:hypothetical protein
MAEKKTTNNSVWEKLSRIDCSEHTEKKQDLTYLSWAWAWGVLKEAYPQASYQVREWNGIPYLHDPYLGYLVETSVTIEGETLTMRLPVMNSSNKAMKHEPYEIVCKPKNKQPYTVAVEAATMFDINTAIMRCLVKNLAMFGLGHYIYAGEDLPNDEQYQTQTTEERAEAQAVKAQDLFDKQKECAITFLKGSENGRNHYLGMLNKGSLDDVTDGEWAKIYQDLVRLKYIQAIAA